MNNKILDEIRKQQDFFDKDKYQYPKDFLMNPPFHTQLEIDAILRRLPLLKTDDTVVDFGAGSGRITIPMLKKNISVLAIDVSQRSLATLKNTTNHNLLRGLRTSTDFPQKKQFPAIVGADILHHISLESYLPIFYKSLRTGGKIIFSEPNAFNPFWYLILPIFSSWEIEKGMLACRIDNLTKLFEKNGFTKIHISGRGIFPGPVFNFIPPLCIANDKAGNLPILNNFSYRLLIEATK